MNKTFCTSCGYKNVYEIETPKFCAGCGQQIGNTIKASEEANEGSAVKSVSAKRLDVEIEGAGKIKWNDLTQEKREGKSPVDTKETRRS